jgi:hypothetical protein
MLAGMDVAILSRLTLALEQAKVLIREVLQER